jgi:DNA ligase (NAD+)
MKRAGLKLPNPDHGGKAVGPLKNLSIVFTGRLERLSCSDAEGLVEALAGRASSNVSGNTDYVVAGPDAGSKLDDAREQDILVMDEEEFASFLQDRGVELSRER